MGQSPFSDFLKSVGWQRQPFGCNAKNDHRNLRRSRAMFLDRKMLAPFAPIIFRQRPIQQFDSSSRVNRAVSAMNEFLELSAGAGTIDADFVPAGAHACG